VVKDQKPRNRKEKNLRTKTPSTICRRERIVILPPAYAGGSDMAINLELQTGLTRKTELSGLFTFSPFHFFVLPVRKLKKADILEI
jgi:hypothetical protein